MTAQTGDIIDILLATYNGEAYLEEQLDSIAAQTHRDWRLIARDDGSADRTSEILDAFRTRHPDKVVVLEDRDGNLGLVQNYTRLMEHSYAPHAAFCDQDDVWIPEKLELSLAKMRELEREHGAETPLLVFTDLTVVDEELKVVHDSFWRYQGLWPERCNALNRLLLQNVVTGCTALMNRPLVEKATPVGPEAMVHDWWVVLVAAAFGVAGYIPQPTVLYRQHRRNLIGAKAVTVFNLPRRAIRVLTNYRAKQRAILAPFRQAKAFYDKYSGAITETHRFAAETFLRIPGEGFFHRIHLALRCGCLPTGLIHKAAFLIICKGDYR
ncbi:MAG: glycosyltransferase family 2 protein [Proteobacteria bacterium]|nr:glycosyltransferase family 2 protein [Pseudomonadota bacterium]